MPVPGFSTVVVTNADKVKLITLCLEEFEDSAFVHKIASVEPGTYLYEDARQEDLAEDEDAATPLDAYVATKIYFFGN